jgi:hypothetical protein
VDGGGWFDFINTTRKQGGEGCAYILDAGGACGAALRPGSSYCPAHHALCHVAEGSAGERRKLKESEALALAVGGKRRRRPARLPPDPFLNRMERVARVFSRPNCSRIVHGDDE